MISPVFVSTLIRAHVVVVQHGITRRVRRVFLLCRFRVRWRTRGRNPWCSTPKPLVPESLIDHTRLPDHCNDPDSVLAVRRLQRIGVPYLQNHIPPFPGCQFCGWAWGGRRTQRLGCDSPICSHMTLAARLVGVPPVIPDHLRTLIRNVLGDSGEKIRRRNFGGTHQWLRSFFL